jgi:hypothetical protein
MVKAGVLCSFHLFKEFHFGLKKLDRCLFCFVFLWCLFACLCKILDALEWNYYHHYHHLLYIIKVWRSGVS